MNIQKKMKIILCTVMAMLALTACGNMGAQQSISGVQGGEQETAERADTGFFVTNSTNYDSADTAILVDMDKEKKSVTFLNLTLGKRYTLTLDGTTKLTDKHGESLSFEQFSRGDIVDITFLKDKKHLTTMQWSKDAWSYENVERYEINTLRNEITIGSETYKITDNTQYLSDGRNIEFMELNSADVLSFQGLDSSILTVNVENGHGYLRLVNDENFVDGWIEIGQSHIQRITEDMLMLVPEGSYDVNISHKGGGGIKSVVINRNEETILDIGDLEVAEAQFGKVLFSLSPSDTELYIDGEEVDASQPVSLEYGLHQMIAKADGYKSVTSYIRVGQESAGIDVVLEKVDEDSDDDSKKEESNTQDNEVDATSSYYKVYIDAPTDVEIYLDGNYVGISPCSFKKTSGTHVITLRKEGYVNRSYTVLVDSEEKDISYSFADLIAEDGDEENSQNVASGNNTVTSSSSNNTVQSSSSNNTVKEDSAD